MKTITITLNADQALACLDAVSNYAENMEEMARDDNDPAEAAVAETCWDLVATINREAQITGWAAPNPENPAHIIWKGEKP